MSRSILRRPLLLFLVLLLSPVWAGCGDGTPGQDGAAAVDTLRGPATEARIFRSEDGSVAMAMPERWEGEVTVRESSPDEADWSPPAPLRIFQFLLPPRDPRYGTENLLNLYLFDEGVWDGVLSEDRAQVGNEVARGEGRVLVMPPPGSNPFPAGSVDYDRFTRLSMSPDEVRGALQLP